MKNASCNDELREEKRGHNLHSKFTKIINFLNKMHFYIFKISLTFIISVVLKQQTCNFPHFSTANVRFAAPNTSKYILCKSAVQIIFSHFAKTDDKIHQHQRKRNNSDK